MMMTRKTFRILMTAAALFASPAMALAEDAISAPSQRTIGVDKPQIEPSLIVMNARGAKLEGDKLTLIGVSPNSIMFADRPVRAAGHALTSHLLEEWSANDLSGKDPPNATVSVLAEDGASVKDAVVVLKSPKMEGAESRILMFRCWKETCRAPTAPPRCSSTSLACRSRRSRSRAPRVEPRAAPRGLVRRGRLGHRRVRGLPPLLRPRILPLSNRPASDYPYPPCY